MLNYLAIRDFAIIDQLVVEFHGGLNVLTGETGAGKSILIQALHLLLGGRASQDVIRTDKTSAEVEGEFVLPSGSPIRKKLEDLDMADCDRLAIRRVVSSTGRNRAFVNGRSVTLNDLVELTRGLVDISGQHEHVHLTDETTHRNILDAFGGLLAEKAEVRGAVLSFRELDRALKQLLARDRERAEREEYLRFALQRIDEVEPVTGEDEALGRERIRLRNMERLNGGVREACLHLYEQDGSAVESLGKAQSAVGALLALDPGLGGLNVRLEEIGSQLDDLVRELTRTLRSMEADPERLEQIENRLAALKSLMRVHGPTLQDVLDKRTSMSKEQDELVSLSSMASDLEQRREQALRHALGKAEALSGRRREVAVSLGLSLSRELKTLAMPGARLEVAVQSAGAEGLDESGVDQVRFLFSANPGEEVRPLSRVASGGELSRVLLGLKVVLSEVDEVPVYVFDEVDAGVGGAVAGLIGAKLAATSRRHHVLCITHLPQIAAFAGSHYVVRKQMLDGYTRSEICLLSGEERIEELARMAGGRTISEETRRHARDLLEAAQRQPEEEPRRETEDRGRSRKGRSDAGARGNRRAPVRGQNP